MEVKRRIYRFRLLNASLSGRCDCTCRTTRCSPSSAATAACSPRRFRSSEIVQAGAERYEVLIDFSRYPVGATVELRNRSNRNNVDFDHTDKVMRFRVVDGDFPTTRNTLTPRLPRHHIVDVPASAATRTRRFELDHDDVTNIFKIDGRIWQDVVDSGYTKTMTGNLPPTAGDVEIWEFANKLRWLVPPDAHPPRRLPPAQPQRTGTPSLRDRPEGHRLRRRGPVHPLARRVRHATRASRAASTSSTATTCRTRTTT